MYCPQCDTNDPKSSVECSKCGLTFTLDADGYFKAGMKALASGDIGRAVNYLQSCIQMDADHLSGRFNLGLALCHMEMCTEAMKHFERVLNLCPCYPGIHIAIGQAEFGSFLKFSDIAQRHCDAMINHLSTAVDNDPEDVDACFSLANAYLAIGDAEQSVTLLKRAHALQSDSHAICFTMAKALRELGRFEEAALMAAESLKRCTPVDTFWNESRELYLELREILTGK